MARKELSLKGLELFQICARKGSLQAAARDSGLSLSTVSHHLRSLEAHIGSPLFDHSRRPMILTPRGQTFLRNIDDALLAIRKATSEAAAGAGHDVSHLRIGAIEDLDSDIIPELAVSLTRAMPNCSFLFHSDASSGVTEMLRNRKLDIGLACNVEGLGEELSAQNLMRDPFIAVLPKGAEFSARDLISGKADLPFLRFTPNLLIGRQIEAHLRRSRVTLANRFECANTQTLLAMVAAGAGWTITTPLLLSRARRFQPSLKAQPYPGRAFARTLMLVSTADCSSSVCDQIEGNLRDLLERHAVAPMLKLLPWLEGDFTLLE
ncbi:LysR family transcriptional regulator [Alphaproteobacteria bacterium KMM 3653]|uniref:LysR family transcriptional regulator n=1 Tax=Harenicola maris TaxID=2841044 RepID=A0AAP2CUD6_9RHOB|nr:LysR family transcriptional regulator [Harenicola maris]